jgi:hypothetical protein
MTFAGGPKKCGASGDDDVWWFRKPAGTKDSSPGKSSDSCTGGDHAVAPAAYVGALARRDQPGRSE